MTRAFHKSSPKTHKTGKLHDIERCFRLHSHQWRIPGFIAMWLSHPKTMLAVSILYHLGNLLINACISIQEATIYIDPYTVTKTPQLTPLSPLLSACFPSGCFPWGFSPWAWRRSPAVPPIKSTSWGQVCTDIAMIFLRAQEKLPWQWGKKTFKDVSPLKNGDFPLPS